MLQQLVYLPWFKLSIIMSLLVSFVAQRMMRTAKLSYYYYISLLIFSQYLWLTLSIRWCTKEHNHFCHCISLATHVIHLNKQVTFSRFDLRRPLINNLHIMRQINYINAKFLWKDLAKKPSRRLIFVARSTGTVAAKHFMSQNINSVNLATLILVACWQMVQSLETPYGKCNQSNLKNDF